MPRNLFRGAPELSSLFAGAPIDLLTGFLAHAQFSEFVAGTFSDGPEDPDEDVVRDFLEARLKALRADRTALIEAEARRVTAMAEPVPEELLRRMAEDPRSGVPQAFHAQRDALARSLWSWLTSRPLLDAAERAMQVRSYRDHGKLYESWSIDASVPLSADEVDTDALALEIAGRLDYEEGCRVEAVDLPTTEGGIPEVLLAVTFFGAYASQRTVRPDRTTGIVYYRPPDELLLVYSQARRQIEICARDAVERRLIARIFAQETLGHDVSNKPLTQKTYDLSPFRKSLKLTIPEQEAHRVRRACVTEVQVTLGEWSRKLTLAVAPEDDIDALARSLFGAAIPSGRGFLTRVQIHIEHVNAAGRDVTLKFNVQGRNRSSIQAERDPAVRLLGYTLLEAWGVLRRIGDFTGTERAARLPALLALYDLADDQVSGRDLDDLQIEPGTFVGAGFLTRKGWAKVVLFEDDVLGEVLHHVDPAGPSGQATLSITEGGSGSEVPAGDLAEFEIRFDYLRDAIRDALKPLGLQGRVREIDSHLHQLGTARFGLADVPVYLARGLSRDRLLERAERHLRGEGNRTRGIVFVPGPARFPFLGCHVVQSLGQHLEGGRGEVDTRAVRIAWDAATDIAARGDAVHFRKQGDDAAQISVPGEEPRIITGAKKVLLFERLYDAHRNREGAVKLSVLKDHAGFSQLPQLFGAQWPEIENRYLHSPRHGFWALGSGLN